MARSSSSAFVKVNSFHGGHSALVIPGILMKTVITLLKLVLNLILEVTSIFDNHKMLEVRVVGMVAYIVDDMCWRE